MKTKKQILTFLLVSVFLIFGTSCMIIHPQHHSKGTTSHSYSRSKSSPGHFKKYSGSKSSKQFAPGKVKKHKIPAKKYKRK